MPLYKTIQINSSTKIYIWKITETFDQLFDAVILNEKSQIRLNSMRSQLHQRGFLSVRKLLQEAGYNDFDLYYDEFGKPHLNQKRHNEPVEVSISHSHEFSTLIISNQKAGIDIEKQREKIISIAHKFVNDAELNRLKNLNPVDYIKKLTVKWGAKEAIFKIRNEQGISFKDHIYVNPFEISTKKTTALLDFEGRKQEYKIFFEEIEDFMLVYAFEQI